MFPLLGLVGLAATAAAKPYYDKWAAGVAGRNVDDVLGGTDPADPLGQAGALARAGLISPADLVTAGQNQQRTAESARQFDLGYGLDQTRIGENIRQFGLTHGLNVQKERRSALDAARERAYRMAGGNEFQQLGAITPDIMQAAKVAIAGNESGGFDNPYSARGPTMDDGDYAIGKYQVMASNVPSWTRKYVGRAMTPEEFAASPEAQERVFEGKFGDRMNYYGNFEDAASEWFTGGPFAGNEMRSDGYMGNGEYVGRAGKAFQRQLAMGQQQREQQKALRGVELEAGDVARPTLAAQQQAQTVLEGLDSLGRFGTGYLNTDEGKARVDQLKAASESLFYTWKSQVYGDAEPSPVTLEQLREAFPTAGRSSLEDRGRLARYYRMMQAELGRKADHDQARILYREGLISREQYEATNGGRLTDEERETILKGGAPGGIGRFTREVPLD